MPKHPSLFVSTDLVSTNNLRHDGQDCLRERFLSQRRMIRFWEFRAALLWAFENRTIKEDWGVFQLIGEDKT